MNEDALKSGSRRPSLGAGGGSHVENGQQAKVVYEHFQMPVNYPRYTRPEYERMPEWKVNCLLAQYGLPVSGDVDQKRKFAMGTFLWSC